MGLDFVIKTSDKLLNISPDVHLVIAGADGDIGSQAKELADRMPRVKYCVNIPFEKKINYYQVCDVFLAPTMEKHACMGVSIKEAMACGKPIIASTSGGIPEAIADGYNGYLIPIKDGEIDEKIFVDRAAHLINEPALCIEMGKRGREKVLQKFTNDQTAEQYLDILSIMFYRR